MNHSNISIKENLFQLYKETNDRHSGHSMNMVNKPSNHVYSEIINYLSENLKLSIRGALVMHSNTIIKQPHKNEKIFKTVLNLGGFNKVISIDDFFQQVNTKLTMSGKFVCVFDKQRGKVRKLSKVNFPYFEPFIGFIMKLSILKFISYSDGSKPQYFNYKKVTKAEVLGRLYASGFRLIEEKKISDKWFFVAEKIAEPSYHENPTNGLVAKLHRIGEGGKIIRIYKFRTMHPYSEFIQNYVYKENGSKNGDKASNDYRVTKIGKFLRKYWLDEIPMIINFIKGDVKLVGVRPLSKSKFDMYPKWLQEKRIKYKPGLVPPFYADMPDSFESLLESESKYLDRYSKSPILTDIRYFFKAFYNILIKQARSQ